MEKHSWRRQFLQPRRVHQRKTLRCSGSSMAIVKQRQCFLRQRYLGSAVYVHAVPVFIMMRIVNLVIVITFANLFRNYGFDLNCLHNYVYELLSRCASTIFAEWSIFIDKNSLFRYKSSSLMIL